MVGRSSLVLLIIPVLTAIVMSSCSKPEEAPSGLELLSGADLVTFGLETDHSFELTDLTTAAAGKFVIHSAQIEVVWADTVSGDVFILKDKQICTKGAGGVKRCYALFMPNSETKEAQCTYFVESVYERRVACLKGQ